MRSVEVDLVALMTVLDERPDHAGCIPPCADARLRAVAERAWRAFRQHKSMSIEGTTRWLRSARSPEHVFCYKVDLDPFDNIGPYSDLTAWTTKAIRAMPENARIRITVQVVDESDSWAAVAHEHHPGCDASRCDPDCRYATPVSVQERP